MLTTAGAFDLARGELDSVSVPTRTPEGMQLAGVLALCRSFLAAVDSRPGDVGAPLEYATELAGRTGEGSNAYGLGFGPQDVGQWRARAVLEAGDPSWRPVSRRACGRRHTFSGRQSDYWVTFGRALSRLRGRHGDAIEAFRRAELISPHHVLRDPLTCEVLAELLPRTRRDSPAGRELQGMAYRAGLPV